MPMRENEDHKVCSVADPQLTSSASLSFGPSTSTTKRRLAGRQESPPLRSSANTNAKTPYVVQCGCIPTRSTAPANVSSPAPPQTSPLLSSRGAGVYTTGEEWLLLAPAPSPSLRLAAAQKVGTVEVVTRTTGSFVRFQARPGIGLVYEQRVKLHTRLSGRRLWVTPPPLVFSSWALAVRNTRLDQDVTAQNYLTTWRHARLCT